MTRHLLELVRPSALTLLLVGCISISNTSNYDAGFEDRFTKATDEIIKRSTRAEEAALRGQRAAIDPQVEQFIQRHFIKADELVLAHTRAVKKALDHDSFASSLNEYNKKRSTMIAFTLKLQPSVVIVESKFANATAFPTGRILVNRPLAEAFDVHEDGFNSVLLGVLIHELIHVRDGHALEQWATADSRKAWTKDKVIGAASRVTALIPFLSIQYDHEYPVSFRAAKQLPMLSEYAADLGAVSLLEQAGFDSAQYLAFLSELSTDPAASANYAPALLRERVKCLAELGETQFDDDIQLINVGSPDGGDDLVQTMDMTVFRKVVALLDSPQAWAKEFPQDKPMSADRRRAYLSIARRLFYTRCAIRHTFPAAPIKNGVLVTPTFDLGMFTQYLGEIEK